MRARNKIYGSKSNRSTVHFAVIMARATLVCFLVLVSAALFQTEVQGVGTGSYTLYFIANTYMEELWIDGTQIPFPPDCGSWPAGMGPDVCEISLQSMPTVIAFAHKVIPFKRWTFPLDGYVSVSDGCGRTLHTDGSWKCSFTSEAGWNQGGFDDTSSPWVSCNTRFSAASHSYVFKPYPDIPALGSWVGPQHSTVRSGVAYARKEFPSVTCPAGWFYFECNCYKFVNQLDFRWPEALAECPLQNAAALLLQISNGDEFMFVRNTIKTEPGLDVKKYWLGGHKVGFDPNPNVTEWVWDDGTSVTPIPSPIPWGQNEPNNLRNEEACLNILGLRDYFFNDSKCRRRAGYICKMPLS